MDARCEAALDRVAVRLGKDLKSLAPGFRGKVAAEFDIWTDQNMRGYLVVDIAWVDLEGIRHSALVGFEPMTGSHTAAAITAALKGVGMRLGLAEVGDKLEAWACAVITDGAANILAIAPGEDTPWLSVHCIAHRTQRAIVRLLSSASPHPDLLRLVNAVKKMVGLFAHSTLRRERYKALFKEMYPDTRLLMPIFWNATRWNSLFFVLVRYLAMHRVITRMEPVDLDMTPQTKLALMTELLEVVEVMPPVLRALQVLWQWTERLQANDATLAVLPTAVADMLSACTPPAGCNSVAASILGALETELRKEFAAIREGRDRSVELARFLHPRYVVGELEMEGGKYTAASLRYIKRMRQGLADDWPEQEAADAGDDGLGAADDPVKAAVEAATAAYVRDIRALTEEQRTTMDPLRDYWCTLERRALPLAHLARHYLAMRPTEAQPEREASLAGLIDAERRNRLLPERLRAVTITAAAARQAVVRPAPIIVDRVQRALDMLHSAPSAPAGGAGHEAPPAAEEGGDEDDGDLHDELAALDGVLGENGEVDVAVLARVAVDMEAEVAGEAEAPRRSARLAAALRGGE